MVWNNLFYDIRREGRSVRTGVHRSNSFTTTTYQDHDLDHAVVSCLVHAANLHVAVPDAAAL